MNRKLYLSIDFDYFSREMDEWDWGHGETTMFSDIAWVTRARWIDDTSLEKHAHPHPRDFWGKLIELGYTFDNCKTFHVADSHMWAAQDFLKLSAGVVEIVNFDAHHDMGYEAWKVLKSKWLDPARVDCSNWLLVLLYQLKWLKATCVYPIWKGTREVKKNPPWNHKSVKGRFQYGVYSDEFARQQAGDVVGVFVAKSSAWLPPWHDQAFVDFVSLGTTATRQPPITPWSDDLSKPLQIRPFDMEGALESVRRHDEMVKEFRNKRASVVTGG